ncbi:MAG: tRNA (5-methylaminomethyl-2-thiouridylate)-methyltransferase [Candidatus Thiodiazotropha sp. (ex Lucina aurantia)]|nr:tRNA (5-methylaminomethyl-2-thiouridylate)-methyltransferase [Candidatus Thiodiazotropha sp. (ex Lucina pensylvanica)]MBT3022658.1 tRNA (5-methylaminomethyl-2-thiouridylate)-methyltransferase [Candidatus Thiodiazotropha taylori]MBV2098310.1 tRNA (5-methylaminomethyl-2-thiouridylate)-methyltransferase [Candidatus Thiodiazotropha sp. (ex Codakia orbicularis)]MBV2101633.1 tRNA (5-methylaminomethyl-2-thiouridylate)-methyltransferase [Candidatus Thiodiazotropha sp. (ex Lucina aurantia)]MBV2116038
MSEQRKAVALISGGLDSLLAARVIQEQGIHVEGINFFTGFCVEGHTHAIRKRDQKKEKRNNALWVAEQLGMKLHIVDIIEEYKQVLLNPKHGYGANLNPCLDCKVFMVYKAYEWIKAKDFDFIITGEVIGQRPMSQRKETMPIVCDESGAHDLLLRPLCAKNLPMTRPEIAGWVDRNRLYGFSGRSRKPQMALAAQFGIEDYAQPAGGCCFLTDEQYAVKLKDLWNARGSKQYELDDIMLLKVGRHLRPSSRFKVIIAREEGEANFLQGYRKRYPHINTVSHGGPLALIDGEINERDIELIGRVVARYSQGRNAAEVELRFTDLSGDSRSLKVVPMPAHQVPKEWLI